MRPADGTDTDLPICKKQVSWPYRRLAEAFVVGSVLGSFTGAAAETIELNSPVACEVGHTCFIQNYVDADPSSEATDYKCGSLTYDSHNGTDFRLKSRRQMGVGVLAAAQGEVSRVRDGVADGSLQETGRDAVRNVECGNGVIIAHADQWETQYCHLAKGSVRVKPGDQVAAGDELGVVGLSGLTEFPHLHFTIKHRGKTVDPFAYGAAPGCGSGKSLWKSGLASQLVYRERAVLNAGFVSHSVTMQSIEESGADGGQLTTDAPALVSFIRVIGLKAGDAQRLDLKDPSGRIIAENLATVDKNKAQSMLFTGRKRPESGWVRGLYVATYVVERDAHVVLEKNFSLMLSD